MWIPKINSKIINFTNILCLFLISIWFVKNILISGCAIYPVSFTCINKLPWHNTDNKSFLSPNQVALASEAWAKNWNTYYKKEKIQGKNIEKINSQKKYIKNFFWLNEWSQDHGKFILKKIFPYMVVILILYIFCRKKISTNKISGNNKLFLILFSINLLALILWFIKFPIMRYGLAYIYIQIFLIFYFLFKNKYFKKLKFIIILSLFIFLSKNFIKIINNFDNTIYPEFYKQTEYFEYKENNFITYYTKENELCGYYKSPCTNYVENLENVETKEYLSYRFYSLKDN